MIKTRLFKLLNIYPGEERNVILLLIHYFFMGAAILFVDSASYALFFETWDTTAMPYVYIGIALIVSSISALFLKLAERASLARFLVMCLGFILAGTVAFRVALALTSSRWLMLALPIWSQSLVNLSVMAFWILAGNIFNVRQGKRIFGLLNAGSWLSYVILGPFTTLIVNAIGTVNLYVVVAICTFIALTFQILVLRANPGTSVQPEREDVDTARVSIRALLGNRYIFLIFGIIAVWRVAYFILNNIFYDRTSLQFPNADALAGFIGGFYAAVGILGFVTDAFLTGRIISRFGLRAGLLATPVLATLCIFGLTLVGIIDPGQALFLFGFAVAAKFVNEGLGSSLDQSATVILFQPIAARVRAQAQTMTDGIVQPLAIGFAGCLLLVLQTLLKFNVIQLGLSYLLAGSAWTLLGFVLSRAYPGALSDALHKRRFGDSGISLRDAASREMIETALRSPHAQDVLYAMELLEKSEESSLRAFLIELIGSPHVEVRLNAIQRVESLGMKESVHALIARIRVESEPEVREAASRAFTVLSRDMDISLSFLREQDAHVRRGALIGLLRSKAASDVSAAYQQLETLVRSEEIPERLESADLLAEIANPAFANLLVVLLGDSELPVRRAALHAAARAGYPDIYRVVIGMLAQAQTRSLAFAALIAGGDLALPEIAAGIRDESLSRRVQARLVRACGVIKSQAAVSVLVACIAHPNARIRLRVLMTLDGCQFRPEGGFAQRVAGQVQVELHRTSWLLGCIRDVEKSSGMAILQDALLQDFLQTRLRLLYLFGFIYDRRRMQRVRAALMQADESRHSYAIETIDSTLGQKYRTVFLPLLEELLPEERLLRMGIGFQQLELAPKGRLIDILTNKFAKENPWLVAIAIELSSGLGLSIENDVAQRIGYSRDTLIARAAKPDEVAMLSTVQRVLVLKSLKMFANTPDEALADLAVALREETFQPGELIVREGEPGESLYIVMRGGVEVVHEARVITRLGERDIFGELSLLDSSPRTATIRAAEETTLLRMDQAPFYDILGDYVEVAIGTIRMLTRSLRQRTSDVIALSHKLDG